MASIVDDVQLRAAAAAAVLADNTTSAATPRAPLSRSNSQRQQYFKKILFALLALELMLIQHHHNSQTTSLANGGVNTEQHDKLTSPSLRHGRASDPPRLTEEDATAVREVRPTTADDGSPAAKVTLKEKSAGTSSSFPSEWGVCDPRTIQTQYRPAGNKVWIVSFAGWDDGRKQNLKQLELDLKSRTTNVQLETLLYTDEDLPQEYYNDFSWAFAKEHYRGFWTWKPWILRNLTETEVFQPNDLVFWLDSDERIRPDSQYFETALCNMEHRNDNYGGIFPFERCFNHKEGSYTKPEVFERMRLDATIYGQGEQIYGGSLGFRVVEQDTLAFLKEWEGWGRDDPIMFGNDQDFGTSAALPNKYKQHKNDQSVFSLMVRSRNMTTWPAPYFWMGDSGVKQCLDNFKRAGYCFFFDRKQLDFQNICRPFETWLKELGGPVVWES